MRILESLEDWDDDIVAADPAGDLQGVVAHRRREGDLDTSWELADLDADGAVLRSPASHEQNVLDELGQAMGVAYEDDEELWLGLKEEGRDRHRWELDPASSDDWAERRRR